MKNYTEITVVLDRSGSMQSIASDTIGGFNSFLQEQRKVASSKISLYQFDNEYEAVYENQLVGEAKELTSGTFVPRGATALLDAIGRTVNSLGARLAKMPDSERPDKVVFVIITDGLENASKEFTKSQINDLITHQREKYNWEFIFLGANQDAIAVGEGLGMLAANSATYQTSGVAVQNLFNSVSKNVSNYAMGATMATSFSDAQRKSMLEKEPTK